MHLSWKVIFSSVIQIVIIVKGIFSVFHHRMFVEQLEPDYFFGRKPLLTLLVLMLAALLEIRACNYRRG